MDNWTLALAWRVFWARASFRNQLGQASLFGPPGPEQSWKAEGWGMVDQEGGWGDVRQIHSE